MSYENKLINKKDKIIKNKFFSVLSIKFFSTKDLEIRINKILQKSVISNGKNLDKPIELILVIFHKK